MGKYDDLVKKFDGTLASVPPEIEEEVLDLYAEAGSIQALEGQHDIPAEIIRVVLEQPGLMSKALARRAGGFALQFVNQVLPSVIAKAAEGGSGAVQAAKLVADVIGATERRSVGRPKKQVEEESGASLEARLTQLAQKQAKSTPTPSGSKSTGKARSRLTPRKG